MILLKRPSPPSSPPPGYDNLPAVPQDNICHCEEHKGGDLRVAGAAVAGGAATGAAVAPVAATGILGALGFTAEGVLAGSWAAAVQSSIGNVAAGSAFAGAQAVGAGAALPAMAFALAAVGGGLVIGCAGLGAYKGVQYLRHRGTCPKCGKQRAQGAEGREPKI